MGVFSDAANLGRDLDRDAWQAQIDALRAERDALKAKLVARDEEVESVVRGAKVVEMQIQASATAAMTAIENERDELRATLAATRERGQALAESIRSMLDKYTDYPTTRLGFLLVLNEWDAAEAQGGGDAGGVG